MFVVVSALLTIALGAIVAASLWGGGARTQAAGEGSATFSIGSGTQTTIGGTINIPITLSDFTPGSSPNWGGYDIEIDYGRGINAGTPAGVLNVLTPGTVGPDSPCAFNNGANWGNPEQFPRYVSGCGFQVSTAGSATALILETIPFTCEQNGTVTVSFVTRDNAFEGGGTALFDVNSIDFAMTLNSGTVICGTGVESTPTSTSTSIPPTNTSTPIPADTNTPVATDTPTNTAVPTSTNTPVPTDTNTPVPTDTNTPVPTDTNTPVPTDTNTPVPADTNTPVPTDTNTPVPADTNTPVPTDTSTAVPTDTSTAVPTDTSTPVPTGTSTNTPEVEPTDTSTPVPTDTSTPVPTATNTPVPTDTSTPVPTDTAEPTDTATAVVTPTNTPSPNTATSTPSPTNTAVPTSTNTAVPTSTKTATPVATVTPPEECLTFGQKVRLVVGILIRFNAHSGQRRFKDRYDVNHDGKINWDDLVQVLNTPTCKHGHGHQGED